jgi:hypothetical protein
MPLQLVSAKETDKNGITTELPFRLIVQIGDSDTESVDLELSVHPGRVARHVNHNVVC